MGLTTEQQKNLAACLPRVLDKATLHYEEFAIAPKEEIKNLAEQSKAAKALLSHILMIMKAAKTLADLGVLEKDTLHDMQNAATRAAGSEDLEAFYKGKNGDEP